MNPPCTDLDAYLDEALARVDREQFEQHLLGCIRCQGAVEDFMQLLAAGAELSQRADRPRVAGDGVVSAPPLEEARRAARAPWWTGRRWLAASGGAAAAFAALLVWLAIPPSMTIEDRLFAELSPHRTALERLPYAPLDRHRPRDVMRGEQAWDRISMKLTAEVEEHRGRAALVAVLLASGNLDQAEKELAAPGRDDGLDLMPDLLIDRAVLAIQRKRYPEALRYLDEVLARSPGHGVALWNRARVLEELQLPLAAAEVFDEVVELGELGWSLEAAQRAVMLREHNAVRAERWRSEKAACAHLSAAHLPAREVVRGSTSYCRPAFYAAVREASSRDDVLALLPVAEELDATAGNQAATNLVHQVAAADPAQRRHAVAAFEQLTGTADLSPADSRRVLDEIRATNQTDIVLAAVKRAGLPGWRDEYATRAAASMDPFFVEAGQQRSAELLLEGGDPLRAEVELRRAVGECTKRTVELRCSYLYRALANIYEILNRPNDEREVARAGLERSRRLDLYWDEKLFFLYLAEAARAEGSHALMRAYRHEAALRSDGVCDQVRYAEELLAVASIDELDFPRARRELARSPACDEAPTQYRARVVAELARIDGTAGEAAELRAGLVRTRQQPDQTPGQLAYLDALEGRLLAARDPGAARPLLQHAIEAADRLGRLDVDAVKARADAYASLLVLAANEGDRAATLAVFARAAGTPLRAPCAMGVMVDAERVLVVTRDRTGKLEQAFEPKGRRTPKLDAGALVPASLVGALSACERVDVLALPPVFGLPGLLPPALAWSYRGRSSVPEAPLSNPPRVVTVADAVPPGELKLAPLQAMTLTPIPGARHTDLRGVQATPANALRSIAGADVVEIHAHGFVDLQRSDASVIALSPEADGHFALNAREIADLRLLKAPLVVLAACHAAYTAPYHHEPWGLPHAFLLAGARAVLASPETISDAEAGGFFRAVEQRILAGTDPAIALRDERNRRLVRDPSSWTRNVLLFD